MMGRWQASAAQRSGILCVGVWVAASCALGGCGEEFADATPPPAACGASELVDRFDGTEVSPRWDEWGDPPLVGVADGRAFLQTVAGEELDQWGSFRSHRTYAFRDCAVWIQVPLAFEQEAPGDTYIMLVDDSTNDNVYVSVDRGWLQLGVEVEDGEDPYSVEVLYDPMAHQWWRLSEQGGTLRFETASDGKEWQTQGETPSPSYLSNASFQFAAGVSFAEPPTETYRAEFDNVNVTP